MSDFIGWIVLGVFAGALAKWLMPGNQGGGLIRTMLLGIAGAFLGGFLSSFLPLFHKTNNEGMIPSFASLFSATAGAFILLLIFRKMKKK